MKAACVGHDTANIQLQFRQNLAKCYTRMNISMRLHGMIDEAAAEMSGATSCTCTAFSAAAVPAAAPVVMAAVAAVPRMLGLLVSTGTSGSLTLPCSIPK